MISVTLPRDSKQFFFDSPLVQRQMDQARRKALVVGGALIRTVAKNSIRKATRMKANALDPDAREKFDRRVLFAKKAGRPKPKLPLASSKPGDPPRSRSGLLKNKMVFRYDPASKSVVIGPEEIDFGTRARSTLESGGRNEAGHYVAPRPYMRPAEARTRSQYVQQWKNAFNKR